MNDVVARRKIERLEEEKRILEQEKQLVVDFMQRMAEALADNPSREDLCQRIVHAAILCTGALSGCIFERTAGQQMRGEPGGDVGVCWRGDSEHLRRAGCDAGVAARA